MSAPSPQQDEDRALAAEIAALRRPLLPRGAQTLGLAVAAAVLTGIVTGLAFIYPLAATAGCVLAAVLQLLAPRPADLPRGTWALVLLPMHFWTFVGWRMHVDVDIVVSHWRCGTGMMMAIVVAPPFAAIVSAVATVVILVASRAMPRAPVALARLSALTFGVVALVVAPVLVHRVVTRPGPDGYVASLPRVTTIQPIDLAGMTCEIDARRSGSSHAPGPLQTCFSDTTVENVVVRRTCSEDACSVVVASAARHAEELPVHGGESMFPTDHALDIHHDVAHQLWIVVDASSDHGWPVMVAFSGAGAVDVSAADVASAIAPEPPVAIAALIGAGAFLASAAIWALRRRRAARLLAAREGSVDAAGWLTLDGEGERPVRLDTPVPEGRVLVVNLVPGDAYRAAGAARVISTNHDEVRSRFTDFETRLAAALAIALPAAIVPVVAAAMCGLLF